MSSLGQAVGGVIGATIGFFTGNPLYGAQIGMMIGGAIDPPKGPTVNGPRLDDLNVQTATYGAFIPRNYGTVAQQGNVFWVQGDRLTEVQTTTTSGGKGGPESTTNTWSYFATFAVGLCKGPIDGVRRIWIGGQLWYDAGSDDIATIISSNEKADLFTVYLGTDTQTADPLIQADKGTDNVPAYCGLAYIVFDNLPLDKYGNSLMGAQVKVELVSVGSAVHTIEQVAESASAGAAFPQVSSLSGRTMVYSSQTAPIIAVYDIYNAYDPQLLGTISTPIINNNVFVTSVGYIAAYQAAGFRFVMYDVNGVTRSTTVMAAGLANRDAFAGYGNRLYFVETNGNLSCYDVSNPDAPALLWKYATALGAAATYICADGNYIYIYSGTTLLTLGLDTYPYLVSSDTVAASYAIMATDGRYLCMAKHSGVDAFAVYAVGTDAPPALLGTDDIFDVAAFSMSMSGDLVWLSGSTEDHVVYDIENPASIQRYHVNHGGGDSYYTAQVSGDFFFACTYNTGKIRSFVFFKNIITPELAHLGEIVEAECMASKLLTTADVDVTELTDTVRGYRVSQQGAIRGTLDPLRAAWPFDVIQHGYKIKFKRRGSASVATIPSSLLDARKAGDATGIQITDGREMDLQLPRRVDVKYLDSTREYDINEQLSPVRTSTDSANIRKIELPIVFTAAEAAQKAETLLYLYWMERHDVIMRLPPEYSELEPGDVITVNSDSANYELRLTSTNTLPDGRIECAAKYNKSAIYTPTAPGEEGQSTGAALSLDGPAVYSLLDIPLMRDDDDTAGFPVAMGGYLTGWPGGVLYRSDDGSQTWTDLRAFTPGAVLGYATGTLSAHGGTVIDFYSTLAVRLYSSTMALSSVTQAQMFSGQNWFAYGAHGRWEIIAASNCVLQGDGSYVLSDFLRGQRGTEWATGLHAANDRIVMLNSAALAFISVNSSTIGTSREYRAITTGAALSSDASLAFSYSGVNLECLSPVHLTGSRHPSTNDWTLSWIRRSRYDQWRDYVDSPLGETSESYEIEIYSSGTYTTLKRTLTASSPTVSYTSAQQVTDFGSNQATLYVKVYQLSATVGRGYALTQSITR